MRINGKEVLCNNAEAAKAVMERLLYRLEADCSASGVIAAAEAVDGQIKAASQVMTEESVLWALLGQFSNNYFAEVWGAGKLQSDVVRQDYPEAFIETTTTYGRAKYYVVVDRVTRKHLGPSAFTEENAWRWAAERIAKEKVVGV